MLPWLIRSKGNRFHLQEVIGGVFMAPSVSNVALDKLVLMAYRDAREVLLFVPFGVCRKSPLTFTEDFI